MNILILSLNSIAHMYLSGISGVFFKEFRRYPKLTYNWIYIILASLISIISIIMLSITDSPLVFRSASYTMWITVGVAVITVIIQLFIESGILTVGSKINNVGFRLPLLSKGMKIELILIGIFEEISYRFFILGALMTMSVSTPIAVMVSALLYMLNHFYMLKSNPLGLYQGISKFVFGVLLAILYIKFSIICCIFTHAFYNIILLFGFSSFANRASGRRMAG